MCSCYRLNRQFWAEVFLYYGYKEIRRGGDRGWPLGEPFPHNPSRDARVPFRGSLHSGVPRGGKQCPSPWPNVSRLAPALRWGVVKVSLQVYDVISDGFLESHWCHSGRTFGCPFSMSEASREELGGQNDLWGDFFLPWPFSFLLPLGVLWGFAICVVSFSFLRLTCYPCTFSWLTLLFPFFSAL